jgi:hypothetical protein
VAPVPHVPSQEQARKPLLRRIDWWRVAPTLVSIALAIVYLIMEPRTVDLATHTFRADLFGRQGFTLWNGYWYGGHHTPAYSVLSPPLAWALGPPVAGALAAVASAALFEPIVHRRWGERARWGAIWFGAATATLLFTARIPFGIGIAFGLASLLCVQRRRMGLAALFAFLCPLGSPVSALFLAMGFTAWGLSARERSGTDSGSLESPSDHAWRQRLQAVGLAAATFLPPVVLNLVFPEGGYAPFPVSSFIPIPIFGLATAAVLWKRERAIAIGALLYAGGSIAALEVQTAMGGNAVRLGALFGGPLLACALTGRNVRPLLKPAVVLAFAFLAFWQWSPAYRDLKKSFDDPAAKASYYEPLRQYLSTLRIDGRVEIPFTRSHWEGAEIAGVAPLARGWLRQLDTGNNPIFYSGVLNDLTYAGWLAENAVQYVALPSVKPDVSSYKERALIERDPPYLHLQWRSRNWRVYRVTIPAPMVIPQGQASMSMQRFGSDDFVLRVRRPGKALVRVRFTPYWRAHGGCVQRSGDWTTVTAPKAGTLRVSTTFAVGRIFHRGRRCSS